MTAAKLPSNPIRVVAARKGVRGNIDLLWVIPIQVYWAEQLSRSWMVEASVRFDVALNWWSKDAVAQECEPVHNHGLQGLHII